MNAPARPSTVLAMRFSALGDVAMTVPPMADAAFAAPGRRFVMLTRPLPARTYADPSALPGNLEVRGVDLNAYKGLAGLWRLSGELWRELRPDTVVDLHDVLRSRILSLFLRMRSLGRVRVGRIDKGRAAKRVLTRDAKKELRPLPSGDSRYRAALRRAGLEAPERFAGMWPDLRQARAEARRRPGTRPRVAIAPFAAHPGKEWPVEKMTETIGLLVEAGCEILAFGAGEREGKVIAAWARQWPGEVTDMCARRAGLQAEMREMAQCDAMVSMDSANMHMASLVGLPVVSIWGATHPYAGFMGWRQPEAGAVQLDLPCRPCSVFGNRPCRLTQSPDEPRPCLAGITPRMVADRVLTTISTQP